jgi:1-acyl-sn-glycerol-3-phosphate acyltransferase
MLIVRNILFATAFYLNNVFWFLFVFVGYPLPRRGFVALCRGWGRTNIWLFETIIGARTDVRGLENVPKSGCIIASKHQSAWETLALMLYCDDPTFILKKELLYVPLFGWHLMRAGQIPVERSGRPQTIPRLNDKVGEALAAGRQIIIFPEGTRRPVGAPPAYKKGIAQMYQTFDCPVVPVALNTGLAWPRRRFLKYPIPVLVEFLEPIPPGLPVRDFQDLLQDRIETATDRLIAEALAETGQTLSDIQSSNVS